MAIQKETRSDKKRKTYPKRTKRKTRNKLLQSSIFIAELKVKENASNEESEL